jgi:hypothetical protein
MDGWLWRGDKAACKNVEKQNMPEISEDEEKSSESNRK